MKYFIDTEFIEGFHKPTFGKRRHFIDLISIGIMCEDGRTYSAVSSEWKYNDADKWVQDNVIIPLYRTTVSGFGKNHCEADNFHKGYGKLNKQIANEIYCFCLEGETTQPMGIGNPYEPVVEFYGHYADYDWVVFCSLFGRMIDLPKGFPMYCKDLKQMLDEKVENYSNADSQKATSKISPIYTVELYNMPKQNRLEWVKKTIPQYPKQENEHNALADAKWNYELFKFINSI